MDLENGNTKPLEEDGLSMPEALGDGWFAFGETSRSAIGHSAKTVLYDLTARPRKLLTSTRTGSPQLPVVPHVLHSRSGKQMAQGWGRLVGSGRVPRVKQ